MVKKLRLILKQNTFAVGAILLSVLLAFVALTVMMQAESPKSLTNLSATDRLILTTQQKLDADPKNPDRYVALCNLYLQKIRETAETELYSKCSSLLDKAATIDANNSDVVATRAMVAYGQHDFKAGLTLAQKALQLNPDKVSHYGLVGDGQIELGQYEEATESIQTMVNKKPELSAYNRVAYIRELYGDIDGAKTALATAVTSGSSFAENVAYSQTELAKLQMRTDLDKAKKSYEQALQVDPRYSPAVEGLGKIAFAKGDYDAAQKYFQQALDILPLAQYATDLGDVFTRQGNDTKAQQQYLLALLALNESAKGGVNVDYEQSVYLSQRGNEPAKAVALARKVLAARPNIFSADALAWALFHDGKYEEAQDNINSALRLGENEPVILYHAGRIAEKLGQREQAIRYLNKAKRYDNHFLDSHFSLLDFNDNEAALKRLAEGR